MIASPPCGGKMSHRTKVSALKALARRRGRMVSKGGGGAANQPVVPYLCPNCGAWHLGHKPIVPMHKRSFTRAQ